MQRWIFAPKPVLIQGMFTVEAQKLRDRFKIRKDLNSLFCLVHCNLVVFGVHVMDGIYLAQPDFYCVYFPLHTLDGGSSSCFPHVSQESVNPVTSGWKKPVLGPRGGAH